MNPVITLTQTQPSEFLLSVAVVQPVFIWGPSGIGKSSPVRQFAGAVGLPCISLLGSQLAPDDILGIPQILNGKSRFYAPESIPRDVALARWFDHYFPPVEKRRTHSRPSWRRAATPDIPGPGWAKPPHVYEGRTFGVILDTSGSMDRTLLAKALGAIASYSMSRDVPPVRLVFCDATYYVE